MGQSKYNDMVLQECYDLEYALSDYESFSTKDIRGILKELILQAEAKGLEGCHFKFKSTMEPYEDYLGSPVVLPCGYREKNQRELEEDARIEHVEDVAKRHGITFWEATQLIMLEDKGITFGTTPKQSN